MTEAIQIVERVTCEKWFDGNIDLHAAGDGGARYTKPGCDAKLV
jgi:hypothetical protein